MTCAKRTVVCYLRCHSGRLVIGSNNCLNPQVKCPRVEGDDYSKCKDVCQQQGHAEIQALNEAKRYEKNLQGCVATLVGHTYACRPCQEALFAEGILLTVQPMKALNINSKRDSA